jgi:hypothetical protein
MTEPLAGYLAVVVQDLDSMGLFLGGRAGAASGQKIIIDPNEHGRVSRDLLRVARGQADVLKAESLLAVPVYTGGDDLLADLARDAGELVGLRGASELYIAELARLVRRHAGTDAGQHREAIGQIAGALDWLGLRERSVEPPGPEPAARVGVFLRQEAR